MFGLYLLSEKPLRHHLGPLFFELLGTSISNPQRPWCLNQMVILSVLRNECVSFCISFVSQDFRCWLDIQALCRLQFEVSRSGYLYLLSECPLFFHVCTLWRCTAPCCYQTLYEGVPEVCEHFPACIPGLGSRCSRRLWDMKLWHTINFKDYAAIQIRFERFLHKSS